MYICVVSIDELCIYAYVEINTMFCYNVIINPVKVCILIHICILIWRAFAVFLL